MEPTPPTTEPTPEVVAPTRRARVTLLLTRASRIALIVSVVAVSWWTLAELTGVLRDTAAPVAQAPTVEERLASPAALESVASLTAGGRWEFSDGESTIAVGTIPSSAIADYWAKPLVRRTPVAPLTDDSQSWGRSILDLVRALEIVPQETGLAKTYVYQLPDLRAEVVTEPADAASQAGAGERLVGARAAIRGDGDQWRTLELSSQSNVSPRGDQLILMPYPPQTERLATRYDARSSVGAEFSRVPLAMKDLLDHWSQAGSPVIFADLGTDSATREGFCAYNGRTLRLILWQPEGENATTVLALALEGGPEASQPVPAAPL